MTATSTTSAQQSRNGHDIQGCFIDTDPPSRALPVNLRIFFNPAQNLALFRVHTVNASRDPFFLDISPDKIHSLALHPGPPAQLDFSVSHMTLIAPHGPLLREDRATLESLRLVAQQSSVRVLLPDGGDAYEGPQLAALCEAVGRGGLRPDPTQTNLQSLYRGTGGRIVGDDEILGPPPSLFSTIAPSHDQPLPPDLSTARGNELPPPMYSNLASPPPPPPLSPPPATSTAAGKKRMRTRTPSLSPSSSSPDYRTWKHLDLVCGEREKMMYELLRRAEKKQNIIQNLMDQMDAKEVAVDEKIARLTALIAKSSEKEEALCEAGCLEELRCEQTEVNNTRASQVSTASASPVSQGSAASASSNISDRIQSYITTQFDQLRKEMACEYATNESVELRISDEMDRMLSAYVEEHQMFEAISEAVDEAMAGLRARLIEVCQ